MGYPPKQVGFLNLAYRENLGNPNAIKVIGDSPEEFNFPTVNNSISKHSFKILLKLLKLYSKIVGDVVPQMLESV